MSIETDEVVYSVNTAPLADQSDDDVAVSGDSALGERRASESQLLSFPALLRLCPAHFQQALSSLTS